LKCVQYETRLEIMKESIMKKKRKLKMIKKMHEKTKAELVETQGDLDKLRKLTILCKYTSIQ
jgi:hypothetical protein